jgi:hypothetical protein
MGLAPEVKTFRVHSTWLPFEVLMRAMVLCFSLASLSLLGLTIARGAIGLAVLFAILSVLSGQLAYNFQLARVVVSGQSLTAHNVSIFHAVRRADRSEITGIDLKPRPVRGAPNSLIWVPFVGLSSGGGFWLEALSGKSANRPPMPPQVRAVNEIKGKLGVRG